MDIGDRSKLSILLISDSCELCGGAEKVAIETAAVLADAGMQVTFFYGYGIPNEALLNENITLVSTEGALYQSRGINAKTLLSAIWDKKVFEKLTDVIASIDEPIVAHVHSWRSALSCSVFSALNKARIPIFITAHDYSLVCANSCFYDFQSERPCSMNPYSWGCLLKNCDKRNYAQKVFRYMCNFVQSCVLKRCEYTWIHISELQRKVIAQWMDAPTRYIRNPVEIGNSSACPNWVPSEPFFLYVGRLSHEKGADLFCEAIQMAGYKGVVIGSGSDQIQLESMYPNILFVGWREEKDVYAAMRRCTALVVPSRWYEGSPLSPVEALLSGVPCIVSDACSAKELVYQGVNGYVFRSQSISALIKYLNKSVKNEYKLKKNIQYTQQGLKKQYSLSRYNKELVDLYFSTVQNRENVER